MNLAPQAVLTPEFYQSISGTQQRLPFSDPYAMGALCGIIPHPTQVIFIAHPATEKVGCCGRRWGKTKGEALESIMFALEHDETQTFIIAPSQDQANITFAMIETMLEGPLGMFVVDLDHSPFPVLTFANGSQIHARSVGYDGKYLRGHHADRVVYDECFPAGTLVDGRAIETIRAGDVVNAWDESSGLFTRSPVTKVISRPVTDTIVEIYAGMRTIVCTPNHPFWTKRGWVRAVDLTIGDEVGEFTGAVQPLRSTDGASHSPSESVLQADRPSLLHEGVRSGGAEREESNRQNAVAPRQSGTIQMDQAANDGRLPQPRVKSEDIAVLESDRASTGDTRRQRNRPNPDRSDAGGAPRLANGVMGQDQPLPAKGQTGVSVALQAGRDSSDLEGGNRDRRTIARGTQEATARSEEGAVSRWARVDDHQIHQCTGDRTFGGLCPGGVVYNLEVEREHTYVANDFIVHNCGFLPRKIVEEVVPQMMITSRFKKVVKISTPFGRNHFYEDYLRGLGGDIRYQSFHNPSWVNPHVNRQTLAEEKLHRSRLAWDVEYCARFRADQLAFFRWSMVQRCISDELIFPAIPHPGERFVIGFDPARVTDRSAVCVLNVTQKPWSIAYLQDLHGRGYGIQEEMIQHISERYNNAPLHLDATKHDQLAERMQDLVRESYGFVFNNTNKYEMHEGTALSFEHRELLIPRHPDLLREIQYFEIQQSEGSSVIKLNAPEGDFFDDYVCALGLALSLARHQEQHAPAEVSMLSI